MAQKTILNTPPTLQEGITKAWKVDLAEVRKALEARTGRNVDQDATVAMWFVHAPWAHMVWSDYVIYAIHLRDIPGQPKPTHKKFPEATHELAVFAINPDWTPVLDGSEPMRYLIPQNYIGQMAVADDSMMEAIIESTMIEIVRGHLSPDTDYRMQWRMRFGSHYYLQHELGTLGDLLARGGTAVLDEHGKPIIVIGPPPVATPGEDDTKQ